MGWGLLIGLVFGSAGTCLVIQARAKQILAGRDNTPELGDLDLWQKVRMWGATWVVASFSVDDNRRCRMDLEVEGFARARYRVPGSHDVYPVTYDKHTEEQPDAAAPDEQ